MAKGSRGGKRAGKSSVSGIKQIIIDFGTTTQIYREENGSVYSVGVGNTIDQKFDITMKDLEDRAKKQGLKIETFTDKQYSEWLDEYKKSRQKNSDFQDFQWYGRRSSGRIMRRNKGMRGH